MKVKEQELKSQARRTANEPTKESAKELKAAKAQWDKELKEAREKAVGLEEQLKSLTENHDILKLDYDAAISELEDLKAKSTEQKKEEIKEKFRKLKEDRDKYKGLHEANRSNGKIIEDKIAKAVRIAEANQNAGFEAWKAKEAEVIRDMDERLLALDEGLRSSDERIQDLSRAKVGLLEENGAQKVEITRLEKAIAELSLSKAEN